MESQGEPEIENTHTELFPFPVINTCGEETDPEKLQFFFNQLIKTNDFIKVISR